MTLAVLADDRQDYRPARFEMGGYGCRHIFEFPSVKLRDYRHRIDELEKSTNPFAVVVLAHLRHQETKSDIKTRLDRKIALAKSLSAYLHRLAAGPARASRDCVQRDDETT